jgi:protein phosphatase
LAREANEDAFALWPEGGGVVVADGMGGYHGGAVASQLCADAVLEHLRSSMLDDWTVERGLDELEDAVQQAHVAILSKGAVAPEFAGMGTTVVAGLFVQDELAFAWVGDSRLYLVRQGGMVQLTTDHTLVQELVQAGLFASVARAVEAGVGDNVLIRALGTEASLAVDCGSLEILDGDLFLFCSDGLNHMVGDGQIEGPLVDPRLSLEDKAQRLIDLACDAGGLDNITVVLAQVAAA